MSENQKKVWITGASRGIGNALAEKYSIESWKVAISARRENLLNEIEKNNENITAFPLDVTNQIDMKDIFNKIINDFSDLDLCIFNSGVYNRKLEKEINLDQIKKTFEVNFLGTVNSVKTVEHFFKNRKKGKIALVSSIAAYRGLPSSSGYGPSKAALTNFAESIYFDFKKFNVEISLISPGFIKTPMTDTNEFSMPFIKPAEYAAEKIFSGLSKKNKFDISFPFQLVSILKFLRILPYSVYLYLVDKLIKR